MLLLLWMFAVFGIADTISKARIGAPLRRRFPIRPQADGPGLDDQAVTFAHMIRCPKCVAWWVSGAMTLLGIGPAQSLPTLGGPVTTLVEQVLLNAFAGAAWCWVVYVVLHRLGADEL